MRLAGADTTFLGFPEAPLRGHTIGNPLDYPRQIRHEFDAELVEKIAASLTPHFSDADEVLAPLATGGREHVDHLLVRKAATLAWKNNPHVLLRLYEDATYIDAEILNLISNMSGFLLQESPIDIEAKIRLLYGYRSQPIDRWERNFREAAGNPPVERTWMVSTPECLECLE